jgi:hypothetical protein
VRTILAAALLAIFPLGGDAQVVRLRGNATAPTSVSAEVSVAGRATGGSGTVGAPWTGWDAGPWEPFTRYRFRSGHYAFATSPNYLQPGIELIGEAGVFLKHTGTGNAFVMDAGAEVGSVWIQNVRVENLIVLGNYAASPGTATASIGTNTVTGTGTNWLTSVAVGDSVTFTAGGMSAQSHIVTDIASNTSLTVDANWTVNKAGVLTIGKTTNGFYLRGVRNGTFKHLAAHDVGLSGLWTEGCVTNSMESFRITYHEPTQSIGYNVRPQYGIVTAGRGADWSTIWQFIDPVIEGVQTAGIWFKADSYGNTIVGGTSEGHVGIAIGIDLDGSYNTVINTDVEANSSANDIEIRGVSNRLLNVFSDQTVSILAGQRHAIEGGSYNNLSVAIGIDGGSVTQANITGTFTDTSGRLIRYGNQVNQQAFLGTVVPRVHQIAPVAGTLNTDARLSNVYSVPVSAGITIANPTSMVNGQETVWRFTSTSNHAIAWGNRFFSLTGAALPAAFQAGTTFAYVTARYNLTDDRWDVLQAAGF